MSTHFPSLENYFNELQKFNEQWKPKFRTIKTHTDDTQSHAVQYSKNTHLYFVSGCKHTTTYNTQYASRCTAYERPNKYELTCYFFEAEVDPSGEKRERQKGESTV